MKKYIINVNGGVFDKGGKNVFDEKELVEVFEEWSEGKKMVDRYGEEVEVKDLIEVGECGDVIEICNKEMCERGDDYVEVSVVELNG